MNTEQVLKMIEAERNYQNEKWRDYPTHSNEEWLTIASEEAGESARALMALWRNPESKSNQLALLQELVQQAAVIAAWIEDVANKSTAQVDMLQYTNLRKVQTAALINGRIGRSVVEVRNTEQSQS